MSFKLSKCFTVATGALCIAGIIALRIWSIEPVQEPIIKTYGQTWFDETVGVDEAVLRAQLTREDGAYIIQSTQAGEQPRSFVVLRTTKPMWVVPRIVVEPVRPWKLANVFHITTNPTMAKGVQHWQSWKISKGHYTNSMGDIFGRFTVGPLFMSCKYGLTKSHGFIPADCEIMEKETRVAHNNLD